MQNFVLHYSYKWLAIQHVSKPSENYSNMDRKLRAMTEGQGIWDVNYFKEIHLKKFGTICFWFK